MNVYGTRMSHSSSYDQFVCRIWLTRVPLWGFLVTSTYGILLTALERYLAVIYPIWYKVYELSLAKYRTIIVSKMTNVTFACMSVSVSSMLSGVVNTLLVSDVSIMLQCGAEFSSVTV